MGLNVGYTCGAIDESIEDIKNLIKANVMDLVYQVNPYINVEDEGFKSYLQDVIGNMYADIEYLYEEVRETNKDLRDDAEGVIEELESRLQDLDNKYADDIEALEDRINTLENERD